MNTRNALLFLIVLLACVGCDQVSKSLAREQLAGLPPISYAADTVRFELVGNPGGFLSLGDSLPAGVRTLFFVFTVPVILLVLCVSLVRSGLRGRSAAIALALLVGGGLGNWIDRVIYGGVVTDFVRLGVGPIHTGIFNVADVAVMAGAAILMWMMWRTPREPERVGVVD